MKRKIICLSNTFLDLAIWCQTQCTFSWGKNEENGGKTITCHCLFVTCHFLPVLSVLRQLGFGKTAIHYHDII